MKRGTVCLVFLTLVVISSVVIASCKAEPEPVVEGTVFEDLDCDGSRDIGEPGIPRVFVSNGITVAATDDSGGYKLPQEGAFAFITTPSDYTNTTLWYRAMDEDDCDFGLRPAPVTFHVIDPGGFQAN